MPSKHLFHCPVRRSSGIFSAPMATYLVIASYYPYHRCLSSVAPFTCVALVSLAPSFPLYGSRAMPSGYSVCSPAPVLSHPSVLPHDSTVCLMHQLTEKFFPLLISKLLIFLIFIYLYLRSRKNFFCLTVDTSAILYSCLGKPLGALTHKAQYFDIRISWTSRPTTLGKSRETQLRRHNSQVGI